MKKYLCILFAATLVFAITACSSSPKPKYTVTFDSCGGTSVSVQEVPEGEKAVKPTDPTNPNGIYFNGWTTDSSASTTSVDFDFDTPITEDITLYAKWTSYIKFTRESGTVTIGMDIYGNQEYVPEIFLQYSYDGKTWFDFTTSTEVTVNNTNKTAYFQAKEGKTNTKFADENKWANNHFTTTSSDNGKVSLSGNIMSLLDNTGSQTDFTEDSVFMGLFGDIDTSECYCPNITDASNLILPAEELAENCYSYMFYGCTSLTNAPELPATSLAVSCYDQMFRGCTSLTNAPELPATSLERECYIEMFKGCTSLTNAPELPATSLEEYCYRDMFYGCTSLTNAPELPATSLAKNCYYDMFRGCTSLTNAPELPATSLAESCYGYMFYGCTSLTNAPELLATSLEKYCYSSMFSGCTSLTNAPELPATTLKIWCYYEMFKDCTNLKIAENDGTPENKIFTCPDATDINKALDDMFANTNGTFKGTPTTGTDYYFY